MAETTYFAQVSALLRQAPLIKANGFVVEVWGKGADHSELLQVKKTAWRVQAAGGDSSGHQGAEVHYEASRPGHWVLHCELWLRLSKKEKERALDRNGLLDLKGGMTQEIRERGREENWAQAYGANLKRAREDARHPSSLIVYTFALGLPEKHTPERFVEKVLRVIEGTAAGIDEIVAARRSGGAVDGAGGT